jgi:hypothetical protein
VPADQRRRGSEEDRLPHRPVGEVVGDGVIELRHGR